MELGAGTWIRLPGKGREQPLTTEAQKQAPTKPNFSKASDMGKKKKRKKKSKLESLSDEEKLECNPHYCKTDLTKATKSFKQVKPFSLTGICEVLCHQGEVLDWGGRPVALENVQVGFAPEHDH